jgi:cytochrome c peroxidase
MALTNVAYLSNLTWANPTITSLEQQAKLPLFGEFPVELGLAGKEQEAFARLAADPTYGPLFSAAYPEEAEPINLNNVLQALASFERTLLSFRSPYDRLVYGGDPSGMSEAALRGKELFFSERTECHHCHGGFNFTDSSIHEGTTFVEEPFHNTGLYNVNGDGSYPEGNAGLFEITFEPQDQGRFRAPSLRNVALTAPYMHDGSVATLEDAIDIYARGGRLIEEGPFAGDGADNPFKSEFVSGFELTEGERTDLVAFLASLTDEEFLTDPAFANPWISE